MPTISQLPTATTVSPTDQLPLSQNGFTRSVAVGVLLGGTQSQISLPQGALLGRNSAGVGGPETVSVGTGLQLANGTAVANGQDHLSFPQTASLSMGDEVVINSSSTPKRLSATGLRALFSAGTGVTIDSNGAISVAAGTGNVGPQGPQGNPGAQGQAGQGFNFRSAWQANTQYAAYDVVTYSGSTYVATTAFTSGQSFTSSGWTLIAAQGAAGATGAQGSAGAQGPAGPIVPATSSSIGAVRPGSGLSVAADGTLSVSGINPASLAQSGATIGQLLGWTGTGWAPTSASAAGSLSGSASISISAGTVTLAQNGATTGQVLTWTGTAWSPQSGGGTSGVASFNARSGAVTLSLTDVTAVLGTGAAARSSLNLSAVAVSGAFSDLSGAPSIPSAGTTAPLANGSASPGTSASFARADHVHPTDSSRLSVTANLADIASAASARTNLGLGAVATLNVGTAAGTVAAGNDSRLVAALQPAAIPAATGQLLGGSGVAGSSAAITIGSGLSLSSGVLTATATGTIPAAAGQLLGGSGAAGSAAAVTVGSGLSLSSGVLTATAASAAISGLSIDGATVIASVSTPYQMQSGDRVIDVSKTSGAATAITLPTAPVLWVDYTIIDGKGDAGSNNITVSAPNSGTINGVSTFVLNCNRDAITFRAVNMTTWRVS